MVNEGQQLEMNGKHLLACGPNHPALQTVPSDLLNYGPARKNGIANSWVGNRFRSIMPSILTGILAERKYSDTS